MNQTPSAKAVLAGKLVSGLVGLVLLFSAGAKLSQQKGVIEAFTGQFGYPAGTILPIGVVEITCVILYFIPRTSVLGAILTTGYLGGAVATHVRVSDVWVVPFVIGVLAWLGLFLRDARIRALIPLRSEV